MKRTLIIIFLLAGVRTVSAQNHINITGTYRLVSVDNIDKAGNRTHLYGDNPQGLLIFDEKGNYTLQIMSAGRPNFATADKSKGTVDENRAAVKGCNTHFGTYAIDEAVKTITFNIATASFPNWEGTQQKRPFTLNDGIFKYVVPAPTTGNGVTGEVVWKRME